MQIKYRKKVLYEMERYPERCKDCPCFSTTPYRCMNECGDEGHCELGYMDGKDMRDFYGRIKFKNCGIENDTRVTLMKDETRVSLKKWRQTWKKLIIIFN